MFNGTNHYVTTWSIPDEDKHNLVSFATSPENKITSPAPVNDLEEPEDEEGDTIPDKAGDLGAPFPDCMISLKDIFGRWDTVEGGETLNDAIQADYLALCKKPGVIEQQ